MREKLAKCGKLEEVRAVLEKVKRSSQIKTSKVKVPEKPKEKWVVWECPFRSKNADKTVTLLSRVAKS